MQTMRPLELILVDDGSGDGTLAALELLRAELGADWVRILALPSNRGAAAARNAGWEIALGEYVAFLDADDSWLPPKIERQCAFMRAHPQFAITGHLARYGERVETRVGSAGATREYREISRMAVLVKNPMVTPSLMVRRDLALRFHEASRYMEDHRFLQEAVFSGLRIARIEESHAWVHKGAFGEGGLSGELWAMERGELDNYASLRRAGHIGALTHGLLAAYSLAKYCRRVAIVRLARAF